MISSGKVRIYELFKDFGFENKDVLDVVEKLLIVVKSYSSLISDIEVGKICLLFGKGGNGVKFVVVVFVKFVFGKVIFLVKKVVFVVLSKFVLVVSKLVVKFVVVKFVVVKFVVVVKL